MKKLMLALFVLTSLSVFAQEDYTVQVNGQNFSVELDKNYSFEINGKKVPFKIALKDTLQYDDELYRFKYPKGYMISKSVIDTGVQQITILTAEGSGIMIQKYSTINPTQLNELMISEITKESLNYGYTMERKDYQKKLPSGQTIKINKAVLKYKDEINIYEVASIGKKDEGLMVITMKLDGEKNTQGEKIINLLWNSLFYK